MGMLAAAQPGCAESSEGGTEKGAGGAPSVKSTELVPNLSMEDFTTLCDEAEGVVEIHAHCGGVVSGPGFSYDSDTDALTYHTCAGVNTCTGFSCVLDD